MYSGWVEGWIDGTMDDGSVDTFEYTTDICDVY